MSSPRGQAEEESEHIVSGISGGTVDPRDVDYEDDSIVVDLSADEESQNWLSQVPEFKTFDELYEEEKAAESRRARDQLE